jgi:beta-mannosidase
METLDLRGKWNLTNLSTRETIAGMLPGCNYLDLMSAGKIKDPFWGQNENEGTLVSKSDFIYSRSFDVKADLLRKEYVDLVLSGVDTLATITVNNRVVAKTENCHRVYRFDVKQLLQAKGNSIEILFESPYAYIDAHQKKNKLPNIGFTAGIAHLRKVQCHFGWDWGPKLPPVGITGNIGIEAYDKRIEDIEVYQKHESGKVTLSIASHFSTDCTGQTLRCTLTDPDGKDSKHHVRISGQDAALEIEITSPKLWWCNGLGDQPLYILDVQLVDGSNIQDEIKKCIGLRTIELDTHRDEIGGQFRFIINGVPIFAKGANWIPTDSFINRTTHDDLRFYIEQAKWANMNMLRVWGGGYYESDDFYDLCDHNGILVWQDFAFACSPYPFEEPAFLENVHQEVIDNVRRLRHHASLALWCGNNENEMMTSMWKSKKVTYESNYDFYYNILSKWTSELDKATPYWPGSPSSGERKIESVDLDYGDNHLWGIWHGLLPVTTFRRMPARFTSEFGLESFPSMRAIRAFTDKPDINYLDPVMLTHQKSAGGNQKILFYLLDQYRDPKHFEDFVYLSQLTQAGAMRFATDEWRRRMGTCNGSIYWQYNDCWPVASWAGIDYLQQPKAVHYHSREYNKPVCLSNDYFDDRAEIYLANDLPQPLTGELVWTVTNFMGKLLASGKCPVEIGPTQAKKLTVLKFSEILAGEKKTRAVLSATLTSNGKEIDTKRWLLSADKFAELPKAVIKQSVKTDGTQVEITLSSSAFARSVYVVVNGADTPVSDNFFDLMPGEEKTVTVHLAMPAKDADLMNAIHLKSLADVEPRSTRFADSLKQFLMHFTWINFSTWIAFKFITRLK